MKTTLAALSVALFLSACHSPKQNAQAPIKQPQETHTVNLEYTNRPPSYSEDEVIGVAWVCLDPRAILMIASAPSEDTYFEALNMFSKHKLCVVFQRTAAVTLKQHQLSFKGAFGHGEVWTVKTKDNSNVFVLVVPRVRTEV